MTFNIKIKQQSIHLPNLEITSLMLKIKNKHLYHHGFGILHFPSPTMDLEEK